MAKTSAAGVEAEATVLRSKRVEGIQGLRALAALAVVVFHIADRLGFRFVVGAAGVDVFFVISGFIMWTTTAVRPPSAGEFLYRRATRVIPLYWLATLGLLGAALAIPSLFSRFQATTEHILFSLAFVPHFAPDQSTFPVLAQGWTLNYEMYFYLVFAFTLCLPQRIRLVGLSVSLAVLALIGVFLRLSMPELSAIPLVATYTSALLLQFSAGIWIGHCWLSSRFIGWRIGFVFIGLGLSLFAATEITGFYSETWRAFVWGVPASLLVAGFLGVERDGKLRLPRWAMFLGDSSYSLYILHPPLVAAICKVMLGISTPLVVVACVAGSCVVASLSYLFVERPLGVVFRKKPKGIAPAAPVSEVA